MLYIRSRDHKSQSNSRIQICKLYLMKVKPKYNYYCNDNGHVSAGQEKLFIIRKGNVCHMVAFPVNEM